MLPSHPQHSVHNYHLLQAGLNRYFHPHAASASYRKDKPPITTPSLSISTRLRGGSRSRRWKGKGREVGGVPKTGNKMVLGLMVEGGEGWLASKLVEKSWICMQGGANTRCRPLRKTVPCSRPLKISMRACPSNKQTSPLPHQFPQKSSKTPINWSPCLRNGVPTIGKWNSASNRWTSFGDLDHSRAKELWDRRWFRRPCEDNKVGRRWRIDISSILILSIRTKIVRDSAEIGWPKRR